MWDPLVVVIRYDINAIISHCIYAMSIYATAFRAVASLYRVIPDAVYCSCAFGMNLKIPSRHYGGDLANAIVNRIAGFSNLSDLPWETARGIV